MILDYLRHVLNFGVLSIGGGSGGNASTQEFKPPSWTTSYQGNDGPWQGYMQRAMNLSNTPTGQYTGQTIADLTPEQQAGFGMTAQIANGTPLMQTAQGQMTATANGAYANTPWTSASSTLGQTASGGALNSNGWVNNDYTNRVIGSNAETMANAYRTGTAAQTDAAFGRQGAYGGSAYNQMTAANAGGMVKSIGDMANQYQLARTNLGAQDYQHERGLQQNAALAGLGAYGQERDRMVGAAGSAPGFQSADLQAAGALTGVGDAYRSYNQDLLSQAQSAWNQQQQDPWQRLDSLGNALARASGNTAGGSSQVANSGYSASPYASLLGLGLAGYGAWNA